MIGLSIRTALLAGAAIAALGLAGAAGAGEAENLDRDTGLSARAREVPLQPALATFEGEYGNFERSAAALNRRKAAARQAWLDQGLKFLKAPKTTRLLQRIVDECLLPNSPWPGAPVEVQIVVERDAPPDGGRRPMAQASSSGLFMISPAMLAKFDTVGMAAFVMSHELAHVQMQHDRDPWGRVTGQVAAGVKGTALEGVERMAVGLGKSKMAQNMLLRAQEDDADFLGLDVMMKCGMSTQGALDTLDKIGDWHAGEGESTHKVADEVGQASAKANDGSLGAFLGIFTTLGKSTVTGLGALGAESQHTHRSYESRERLIKDYIAAHHRNAPGGEGHSDPFADEWDELTFSDGYLAFLAEYGQ